MCSHVCRVRALRPVPCRARNRESSQTLVVASEQDSRGAVRSRRVVGVAMTTNDKHCQTQLGGEDASVVRGEDAVMFDESVAVEGQEVDSSTSSEDGAVRAAMSKFQPPARHDFDSDSDSSPGKLTADLSEEDLSPQRRAKSPEKHEASKGGERPRQTRRASSNSESDSGEEVDARETVAGPGARRRGPALPAEGAYDPEHFRDLKVPPDMENLFQYISKYTPQKIELEGRLRAFVPECAPAVGDCDALLKLSTPLATLLAKPLDDRLLEHIDNLGVAVLDEPAAEQSEPALLHLQLRALSNVSAGNTTLTRKISDAEKNPKAIERWIKDVSELHASRPPPAVAYAGKMPDIDSLMEEWPECVEEALNEAGFPGPALECSLAQYAALAGALLDVPLAGPELRHRIQAVHLLFSLYCAVKNSQLYAQRQKETEEE